MSVDQSAGLCISQPASLSSPTFWLKRGIRRGQYILLHFLKKANFESTGNSSKMFMQAEHRVGSCVEKNKHSVLSFYWHAGGCDWLRYCLTIAKPADLYSLSPSMSRCHTYMSQRRCMWGDSRGCIPCILVKQFKQPQHV